MLWKRKFEEALKAGQTLDGKPLTAADRMKLEEEITERGEFLRTGEHPARKQSGYHGYGFCCGRRMKVTHTNGNRRWHKCAVCGQTHKELPQAPREFPLYFLCKKCHPQGDRGYSFIGITPEHLEALCLYAQARGKDVTVPLGRP